MELKFVDPRALKENPDKARRSKSNPQADALLLATIKAIGIVQPPIVAPETSAAPALRCPSSARSLEWFVFSITPAKAPNSFMTVTDRIQRGQG